MSLPGRAWCLVLLLGACGGACGAGSGKATGTVEPGSAGSAAPADAMLPVVAADAAGSTAAAGAPAPLTEAMATPYFTSGDAGDGARAFQLEQFSSALAAFRKARAAATGADVPRLELLLGLTQARLGDWGAAAAHLATARAGLPLLADYLTYQLARARYFGKQVGAALALAREVSKASIHGADAELLAGDALRGNGDWAGTAAHYQDYLVRRPTGPRRAEVRFRIAEALQKIGGDPAAIALQYRRITIEEPLSSWATKSPPVTDYTASELLERGMELFDAMRNPESEAAFTAALAMPTITADETCIAGYHAAQSRFKARDRKVSSAMFDVGAAACKASGNTDLQIKSLYRAGRAYAFIGQHDTATARYQAAQRVDPAHSYADDALLREAEEWTSRGDGKQAQATLASLPKQFPEGDNVAEAMWRLGHQAWKRGDTDAAIKSWKQQATLVPHDDNYFGEGQAQYWLGRAYAKQGKQAEALASWEAGVRKYPAAYYAMIGLNRIRETDAKRFATLAADLAADPDGFDAKAPAFTFQPRVEYGQPGFQRALELLRLGLGDSAEAELRKLGLTAPKGKRRVEEAETVEKLWAMAYLFDRAGRFDSSHWPTRWHILDYRRAWPSGTNRARWQIAYPRAYADLLAAHAKTNNVPFAMQIAIVREESAFDPLLESYANAIGLTQMIAVTAERFAKGTGITPNREALRDPEKNVTIGSRFLGHLFAYWKDFTALVPASYNGGEGYVRRNLAKRGTQATDEFIEGILDDQIRNYSKRVLGTFFTYSWLYERTIPLIPNTIPTALLPKP